MKKVTMFGGKGGVGKSTCAGVQALHHALGGEKTLVISTDPTPSLAHLFEIASTDEPTQVRENLYFLELGMREIKEMWDEKFGHEVYEVFSALVEIDYPEFVDFITSILPGLQEEFMVDTIRELFVTGEYQRIVWDTAPLGQTMGLLKMPHLLSQHLKKAPRIYSRLILGRESRRPLLKIIETWSELSRKDIFFLQNQVSFTMVTIPACMAVKQLEGIRKEFEKHQLPFSRLIINHVVQESTPGFLQQKKEAQDVYRKQLYQEYNGIDIKEIPAFSKEVLGLPMLEKVREILFL